MAPKGMRSFERNHYFYGKLMTARDFKAEQEYHREKQWLHTRLAHDFGAIGGLKVETAGEAANPWLMVLRKGIAVDAEGREIVVAEDHYFDLSKLMFQCGLNPTEVRKPVYLTLSYQEREGEPVPVYARDGGPDEGLAPNRVTEGFALTVTDTLPATGFGLARELTDLVETALNPTDLASAYRRTGGVGIPPSGTAFVAAAADSEDLLVGGQNAPLSWVTGGSLTKEDVVATSGNVVGIATAPGVAWVATATTVRMALWPAGSAPAFTLSWTDQSISAVAAHPVAVEGLHHAYYLATIPDLNYPELAYWRLARVSSDGTPLELQQLPSRAKCLAVSPDGSTLFFAQRNADRWHLMALDLGTNTLTVEMADMAEEPLSLHTGTDGDKTVVLVATPTRYLYHKLGNEGAIEVTFTDTFTASCATIQGSRALIAGRDAVAKQWALQIYDLVTHTRLTHVWLLGTPRSVTAVMPPSYRVYVGTDQGVEMIDVPVQTNDLYRLLAERSMKLDVARPVDRSIVLAAVPLRNGLPDILGIDNVSHRRVLVGSGDLLGMFSALLNAVAKGGFGNPTPTDFRVVPRVVSSWVEDRKYTVRVEAAVTDADGNSAPQGVAVNWKLTSTRGDGSIMPDVSFTDPSGIALATASGLTAEELYSISALVGGRGDTAQFRGEPIQLAYGVTVTAAELRRETDGFFTANLEAVITENDGPAPRGLQVTWRLEQTDRGGAFDITDPTPTDGEGKAANVLRRMRVGTDYVVIATVEGENGRHAISVPVAPPVAIVLEPQPFVLHEGQLSRHIKATVKDEWGFAIPNAPDVTWTGDRPFLQTTTTVNSAGVTTALALGFATDNTAYRLVATCGAATAEVTMTPRLFPVVADVTQQPDGKYTVMFTADVKDDAGQTVPAGRTVRWHSTGGGALSDDDSVTNTLGKAFIQVIDLPFGQAASITVLGQDGVGYSSAQAEIDSVTIETGEYRAVTNKVVRTLTAVVKDKKGAPIPAAGNVSWTTTRGTLASSVAVNDQGQSVNVLRLLTEQDHGNRYVITASIGGKSATLDMTPRVYRVDFSANVQTDLSYQIAFTAWAQDILGNPTGAGADLTWDLSGAGAITYQMDETDTNSAATAVVAGVQLNQTAVLMVLGKEGWGYQEVQPQVVITLAEENYTMRRIGSYDYVCRKINATVRDVWNKAIPAGQLTWSDGLETITTDITGGSSFNWLNNPTAGATYTITASFAGQTASRTFTPAAFTVTRVVGGTSVASTGIYTVQVSAATGMSQAVNWHIVGGGSVGAGGNTDPLGVALTTASDIALNGVYTVVVTGVTGFGRLEVRPVIQSVSVELGNIELTAADGFARQLRATVLDSFGLKRPNAAVAWVTSTGRLDASSTATTSTGEAATNRVTGLTRGYGVSIQGTHGGVSSGYVSRHFYAISVGLGASPVSPNATTGYDLKLSVTGAPPSQQLSWTILASTGTGHTIPGTTTASTSGTSANTAQKLTGPANYTFRVMAADGYGEYGFGRTPTTFRLERKFSTYSNGTREWPFEATVSDSYGGVPGWNVHWELTQSDIGSWNYSSGTGKDGIAHHTSASSQDFATGTCKAYVQNWSGHKIDSGTYSKGSGTFSYTVDLTQPQPMLAPDTNPDTVEVEEEIPGPIYKRDQLEDLQTIGTMEFARLSAMPETTEAQAAHQVSLRSAGAMREEGDRYALKVIATVKGAEGAPMVGTFVAWEGVPAEQIEVLAAETDEFGTAAALVHGLSSEEVYGITAVAGDGRDTLFADKSTVPGYYLVLAPLPAGESGEAGFTIDLRDADQAPVKGATVRYTIHGGAETTAGKLVTSRAREPKPLTVMGLKAGVAYDIEVSGKDVIALLRYTP